MIRSGSDAHRHPLGSEKQVARASGQPGGLASAGFDPVIDISFCLIAFDTIALLQATNELVLLPLDRLEVVIGELAPLCANVSPKLLPLTFNLIPIHRSLLLCGSPDRGRFAPSRGVIDHQSKKRAYVSPGFRPERRKPASA
jgi:hypothetical protein